MNRYPHRTVPFTSPQELLDFIAAHLLRPGATRAVSDGWQCCYRTLDGNRCAIGACINDEDYLRDFEGQAISESEDEKHIALARAAGIHRDNKPLLRLASGLQSLHDHVETWLNGPVSVAHAIAAFATRHELAIPAVVHAALKSEARS